MRSEEFSLTVHSFTHGLFVCSVVVKPTVAPTPPPTPPPPPTIPSALEGKDTSAFTFQNAFYSFNLLPSFAGNTLVWGQFSLLTSSLLACLFLIYWLFIST